MQLSNNHKKHHEMKDLTLKTEAQYKEWNDQACNPGKDYPGDEHNPAFLLSGATNEQLAAIITGKIDPVEIARIQLAGRGFDTDGKWIGFNK